LLRAAKGGRFRVSSHCVFLTQRDALGVHASLFAEPSALRWALGVLERGKAGTGRRGGVLDACVWGSILLGC
jgi:hypothetical protein